MILFVTLSAPVVFYVGTQVAPSGTTRDVRIRRIPSSRAQVSNIPSFDGLKKYSVPSLLEELDSAKVAAVYQVFDSSGRTSFVGISRNVGESINTHLDQIPDMVTSNIRLRYQRFKALRQKACTDNH